MDTCVYYSIRGKTVIIHRLVSSDFYSDIRLDEESLRGQIFNIKAAKAYYHTEEVWQHNLTIYENALDYLLMNQER